MICHWQICLEKMGMRTAASIIVLMRNISLSVIADRINYVRKQHPKQWKKIKKKNIAVMLKMDGIDMIPDLRYRFTMKVVRLSGTMCLVQDY